MFSMGILGRVDWGAHDGDLVEKALSVMLLQDRVGAWRRQPSRGDGGVDLAEPMGEGYRVTQIKSFTGALDSSRKTQITNSLERVKKDPRLPGPVFAWDLLLPMDPSSEAETWFSELTQDAPFPCSWLGFSQVEKLAASNPHVVDYYFRDGKAALEARLRDLGNAASLFSRTESAIRAGEIPEPLLNLRAALAREDPHYRYEFRTTAERDALQTNSTGASAPVFEKCFGNDDAGYLTVSVYPKYPQALVDRPILISLLVDISQKPVLDELRNFGVAAVLDSSVVPQVGVDAPGGLGSSFAPARIQMKTGVSNDDYFPYRMRFRCVDEAEVVQEVQVVIERGNGGISGWELHGTDLGGAFEFSFRMTPPRPPALSTLEVRRFEPTLNGKVAAKVLSGARLMNAMHQPRSLVVLQEYGTAPDAVIESTSAESPLSDAAVQLISMLTDIQAVTSVPILVPTLEEMSDEIFARVYRVWQTVRGEEFVQAWLELEIRVPIERLDVIRNEKVVRTFVPLVLDLPSQQIELGRSLIEVRNPQIVGFDEVVKTLYLSDELVSEIDVELRPDSDLTMRSLANSFVSNE
jgi:hypothetical protein